MRIHEKLENGVLELKLDFNASNTLTREALLLFADVLEKYSGDKSVRVLVLSSASTEYFSNGLDPALFVGASKEEIREKFIMIGRSSGALMYFPVPVIMMIEGHCMAMGAAYAISCDYRFMSGGRIGFPESQIAMLFPVLPTIILKEVVGLKHAKNLLYMGRAIKAPEALDISLIDEMHTPETIREKTFAFAAKLAKLPYEALTGMKQSMRAFPYRQANESTFEWDLNMTVDTVASPNSQEGFRSILEGRRPKFT